MQLSGSPLAHGARVAWSLAFALFVVAAALAVAAASAAADSPSAAADSSLEGVWSFNGGRVAIQSKGDGTMTGTVLAATKFAECQHEVGEQMWTDITAQADGSFSGLHQWFYDNSGCKANPTLGPTAWRVLPAGTGKFLRVCMSEPGGPQPTIDADGEYDDATFGCVNSAPVSELPVAKVSEFLDPAAGSAGAGSTLGCIATDKRLRLRVRNPQTNPLSKITVAVKGGGIRKNFRVKPRPKSFVASLNLAPITAPTVRATVRLTTVLGAHLRHRKVYRRC
jgi:hypothetical protein